MTSTGGISGSSDIPTKPPSLPPNDSTSNRTKEQKIYDDLLSYYKWECTTENMEMLTNISNQITPAILNDIKTVYSMEAAGSKAPTLNKLDSYVQDSLTAIASLTPFEKNMLKHFNWPRDKTHIDAVRGFIKEIEMASYRYLKDVFEKSRERRKEELREELKYR